MKRLEPKNKVRSTSPGAAILAIVPGSRYLGTAFFREAYLVDWRIKVVQRGHADRKAALVASIVDALIAEHRPSMLAIKQAQPHHCSTGVNCVTIAINGRAAYHGLRVYALRARTVARLLGIGDPATRHRIFQHVVAEHPTLHREFERHLLARHPYHGRMIEAVALGMAARRYLGRAVYHRRAPT